MLVYLAKGTLPWIEQIAEIGQNRANEIVAKCLEIKQSVTTNELCKDLPDCFVSYFDYVRKLEFEEEPDYKFLRRPFDDYIKNKIGCKLVCSLQTDWAIKRLDIMKEKIRIENEKKYRE